MKLPFEQIYRLTAWSPILFLGALVALTYWLDAQIQSPLIAGSAARHDPDIFIKAFKATVYNKEGRPQQSLTADYGEHFADDDSFELKNVKILLEQINRPPLTVTANDAFLSGDKKDLSLKNNVIAERAGCAESQLPCDDKSLKLLTEYLHLLTDTRVIDTDLPVTLISPDGEVRANGIIIDDQKRNLTLQSNIRGTFLPRALPKKP
ncbi:MAG: LPS export ABC transporter periplasmic protein LptC [Burkholderiales bacterium]|jgi:LPS export ABC transporter protein LptC|nr:LPS export ABC transporter periplasmic protein LptC [Burkholderiales bacterium]